MEPLAEQKCVACEGNSPRISDGEITQFKPQIPDWNIVEEEGEARLKRVYKFPDFMTALNFTNKVAEEAEKVAHHPALLTEWGKVTVSWWTHSIRGLHKNDFVMAAKTDKVAKEFVTK